MHLIHTKDKKFMIRTSAIYFFLFSLLALFSLYYFEILPLIVIYIIALVLFLIFIIRLLLSFRKKAKWKNMFMNCLLSALLAIGSFMFPYSRKSIENIFASGSNNAETINFYVLTQDYKKSHAWRNTYMSDDIKDYQNDLFVMPKDDSEKAEEAIKVVKNKENIEITYFKEGDFYDAAGKLYAGEAKVLVLTADYAELLEDTYNFPDFKKDTKIIYSLKIKNTETVKADTDLLNHNFMIYLAGDDTRDGVLSTTGRFDVNMLLTINPNTKQVFILSIPRDSYIPNPYLANKKDKLTHMGIYGISNSIDALNNYFATDIRNYIVVNFKTFAKIVDAIGGIDIDNPYAFEATEAGVSVGYSYPEGNIHLNGEEALAYVRERYTLKRGDFDRNQHQILVMQAIIKKIKDPATLLKIPTILNALQGTFLTNLASDKIYDFLREELLYLNDWETISYHLKGSTGSAYVASMPREPASVVYLYDQEVALAIQAIKDMNDDKKIRSETFNDE